MGEHKYEEGEETHQYHTLCRQSLGGTTLCDDLDRPSTLGPDLDLGRCPPPLPVSLPVLLLFFGNFLCTILSAIALFDLF